MLRDQTSALAAILLCFMLVLGGGGSYAPFPELILELLAATILLAWVLLPETRDQWRHLPRPAVLVAAAFVALPLIQLVPLPPLIWHHLPGRAIAVDALGLIGQQDSWRPLSLAPSRTLSSLLSLLPP